MTAQAKRGETRVMFLGGALDHGIRAVPADEIDPRRPRAGFYKNPVFIKYAVPRDEVVGPETPHEIYELRKCASGNWHWWAYVLIGYDPPVSHLLDADPGPYYRS